MAHYYGYSARSLVAGQDDYDLVHYYLNAKYFDELGHFALYEALLVADEEAGRRIIDSPQKPRRFRDLRDYGRFSTLRELRAQREHVRRRFSDARWRAFVADVAYFSQRPVLWRDLLRDHGYNPAPVWTLIGGALASVTPVASIKGLTHLDTLLVAAMFLVLGLTLGRWVALIGLLWFGVTLSGYWPKVGTGLLRFDWLAATMIAYGLARIGRPRWAGGLLAYAASVRVFPAVFLLPWLVTLLAAIIREEPIPRDTRQLLGTALAVAVLLNGAAMLRYDGHLLRESVENIAMHGSPASYSSQRVGLGDALVFRGERSPSALEAAGGISGKGEALDRRSGYLWLLGAAFALLWGALVLRRGDPAEWMPLGVVALFIVTTPNIAYFSIRLLLVAWALRDAGRVRGIALLVALFALEVVCLAADEAFPRYFSSGVCSVGMTLIFVGLLATWLFELLPGSRARRGAITAALLAGLALPACFFDDSAPAPAPEQAAVTPKPRKPRPRRKGQRVHCDELQTLRENGAAWNARGHVRFPSGELRIHGCKMTGASLFSIALDRNDRIRIQFLREGVPLHTHQFTPIAEGKGLAVHQRHMPHEAWDADEILLKALQGDGRYSVGHLIFYR